MKKSFLKALTVAIVMVVSLSLLPLGKSQIESHGYTSSFLLLNHPDGDQTYELNITIPGELYEYFTMQSHFTYSAWDLAKFVTPYTLKPVADKLWQIYNNTEDFTNGVLMLVHQIAYKEVVEGRYPVETLADGYGDCDLFVYIAASILEAGGISTVLIYYKDLLHMEIGVHLDSAPTEARVEVYSVSSNNISYYIGEATGNQWRDGWRIGETPSEYQNVTSQIIPLENPGYSSIGQVSATLRKLDPSQLMIKLSLPIALEDNNITISGQILPPTANQNVTLKAKINSDSWTTIGTVETQVDGRFSYDWTTMVGGVLAIQASWPGNRQYNGATSTEANVVVLPLLIIVLFVVLVVAIVFFLLVVVKVMRKRPALDVQPSTTSAETK